jgi:chaperonin cofactor prefoldin
MDPEISKKLADLRKLERQAKQLIYKMDRIEAEWNQVKKELEDQGKSVPHQLGDVLFRFRKKDY